MSRELWAVELDNALKNNLVKTAMPEERVDGHDSVVIPTAHWEALQVAARKLLDFDAIWRRYYETANRRFEAGLSYDELKQVVLGGTE